MFKNVFHIENPTTPVEMYEVDARGAVANFPEEYSEKPWSEEHTEAWREKQKKTAEKTGKQEDSEPANFTAPFEAKNKGRGWWAIYDATGAEVVGGMREADGIAFNDMSDDDKQEYVNAELAKG